MSERAKKTQTLDIQMKDSTKTSGLDPSLVRRIQLSVVQSTGLYDTDPWCTCQKNH